MVERMDYLKQVLVDRLKAKGVDVDLIPGLIRTLANTCLQDPEMGLSRLNKRLAYLGWGSFHLDYHTFQLFLNCFEYEGMKKYRYESGRWFNSRFVL